MRILPFRTAGALTVSAALFACAHSPAPLSISELPGPDTASIRRDIEYLASDHLEGRATGSVGNDLATEYAAKRFAMLGLRSFGPGYFQPFVASSAMAAHTMGRSLPTQNVVGYIPGSDATLQGQVIIIGAHIDHVGRGRFGALDSETRDAVRNGADDNASGTAVVFELARLLRVKPPRRTLVFVNFSGEELGLLGSRHFVSNSPVPVDSMVAMLNFDMVGRLRGDDLIVYGVQTALELSNVLQEANQSVGLRLRAIGDGTGPSDHTSFYLKSVPVLHFFTGLHADYHRATDDAFRINYQGTARVVELAEKVVRRIDSSPTRLTFVRAVASPPVAAGRTGSNVYLGSIPDMAGGDVTGLRLSGVRAGSPADSAGLKEGDVVVELGGRPVSDLQTYSNALYSHNPGDEVEIVVLRNGERIKVRARLGRRG